MSLTGCNYFYPNYHYEANKDRTTQTYKILKRTKLENCINECNKDKKKCNGFVFFAGRCVFKRNFGGNSVYKFGSQVWVKCKKRV